MNKLLRPQVSICSEAFPSQAPKHPSLHSRVLSSHVHSPTTRADHTPQGAHDFGVAIMQQQVRQVHTLDSSYRLLHNGDRQLKKR